MKTSLIFKILLIIIANVGLFSCVEDFDEVINEPQRAFSPNGDGINDEFLLDFLDLSQENVMYIGCAETHKKVFSTNRYQENFWNGKVQNEGKLVSPGTCFYELKVNKKRLIRGSVYVAY